VEKTKVAIFTYTNHKDLTYSQAKSSSLSSTRRRAGRLGFDSRQEQGRDFSSSPPRPDRFWSPPSLLSNGYGGIFPRW